jgi:hypothetical protein
VPAIDPQRTMLTARIVWESASLRGLYEKLNRDWACAIADALAERRGLNAPDDSCKAIARASMGIFGASIEVWVTGHCRHSLADAIERNFEAVCAAFERPVSQIIKIGKGERPERRS